MLTGLSKDLMKDVTQCSQFIANSFKVYDFVRFQRLFILFSFCSFDQLVFYSHH